jgi:hypothetical protein
MNLISSVETPVTEFIRSKYREYLEKAAVIDRDLKELSALELKMMDRLSSGELSTQESEFIQKQLNDIHEEAVCLFKVRKSLTQSYRLWLC